MNRAIKTQNDRFVKNCLPELKKFIKEKRKQDPDYGFICNRQIENIIIFQVEQNTLDSKNIAKNKSGTLLTAILTGIKKLLMLFKKI